MENRRSLYLMISHTDTAIGKIIRTFTGYEFNHVSLSLDPSFAHWVSFARYTQDAPLAGGFIVENADRFFAESTSMPVRIFRMEISEHRYRILKKLFADAGKADSGLIYNTFGALASGLHLRFPVAGAYTCLEFANAVLNISCCSIRALNEYLSPWLIYEGELHDLIQESGSLEGDYFRTRGFFCVARDTFVHFYRLLRHTVSPNRFDPLSAVLRLQ